MVKMVIDDYPSNLTVADLCIVNMLNVLEASQVSNTLVKPNLIYNAQNLPKI